MRALCNGVSGSRIVLLYNGTQFHIYVRTFTSLTAAAVGMHPVCSGIFIKRNRTAESKDEQDSPEGADNSPCYDGSVADLAVRILSHPSADNLPGLQSLQMDDLRELKRYKRRQLISVWDDPVRKVSPEQDLTAGELVGRIEETGADGDFEDWDATVLPEGTKIYETDDAQIMLAECEGEFVPYLKYVEG